MAFFVPEYGTLKAANSLGELPTVQPNEYVGLALKCPISVEKGITGGGDIGATGAYDISDLYIDHIANYRNLFLTPQREFFFSYLKLDRALLLDNKTFSKTNYSRIVKDIDSNVLNDLLDQFITSIDKKRIHRQKYFLGLNMVVANLIQGFFSKRLLLISRHNGALKENNPSNIDNRLIVDLCDWLSTEGYIELLVQPNQLPSNVKLAQSSFLATTKLIRLVSNYRVVQGGDHLLLRNDKKEEIKIPKDKAALLKAKAYRVVIEDYFKLTVRFLFTLDGIEIPVHGKRIFNRNIDLGGRFYASYQNIPSSDRKRIKINHQKTIELDFKSLHYNILYSMVGEALKGDPYIVPGHDRNAIKVISFQLLNTEGEEGLNELARMITLSGKAKQINDVSEYDRQRGMYQRQVDRGLRVDAPYKPRNVKYHIDSIPEGTDGKQLVSDLLDRHSPIKHLIGSKDIGLRLQNMDSNLMGDIMDTATREGIPLLFVHDSCICTYDTRQRVKEIMIDAYKAVTGFNVIVTQPKRKR